MIKFIGVKSNQNRVSVPISPEPNLNFYTKGLQISKIPPDAATIEDQFLSQTIDKQQELDKYFKIIVTDVSTPTFFWFQIEGVHTTKALGNLMNQLE